MDHPAAPALLREAPRGALVLCVSSGPEAAPPLAAGARLAAQFPALAFRLYLTPRLSGGGAAAAAGRQALPGNLTVVGGDVRGSLFVPLEARAFGLALAAAPPAARRCLLLLADERRPEWAQAAGASAALYGA